jgi:hypothetical protein
MRGVMPPEQCVPGDQVIEELAQRNIIITKRLTDTENR